jgi:hypothetical protein
MQSKAKTVKAYLAELPSDRREAISAVRAVILKNLPKGYEEGMQYGMIGYFVPHSVYPPGYHCDPQQPLPFASLASQKNHMAIYMMTLYSDGENENWFREAWEKTGKKLDMGKCCIRFKRLEDVPLPLIGQAIKLVSVKKYIEHYETVIKDSRKRSSKTVKKKGAAKKPTAKKKAPTRRAKR